jgi:AhpD family alkylhydroperoxidase
MKQREKLLQALPGVASAQVAMVDEAYKDGAFNRKVKGLMASAVALRATCTPCILAQTMRAIEAGATKEEILETIGVATTMRGTTGSAESLIVVKLLEELGKI